MHPLITQTEEAHRKPAVSQVRSGDTVRVHQLIREGSKQRIQIFEGVVIRTHRLGSLSATLTVRRIASGIGVEKTYLLHSPNVDKVEILRRAKVRRNFLSYLRQRRGKSARLQEVAFDRAAVNAAAVKVQDVADDPLAHNDGGDAVTDNDITDIDADAATDELNEAEVSTDEIAKEETKQAAADDAKSTDDGTDQPDEAMVPAEEVQSGVDRAEPNEPPT